MRILTVVLLLLTGCGPRLYQLNGKSEQQFRVAEYECERDRRMTQTGYDSAPSRGALDNMAVAQYSYQLFDMCMNAKGFPRRR